MENKNLKPYVIVFYQVLQRFKQFIRVMGKITRGFPASKFTPLHYRKLGYCKTNALKQNRNNFYSKICLSEETKDDLTWLRGSIDRMYNNIIISNPHVEIIPDASLNFGKM